MLRSSRHGGTHSPRISMSATVGGGGGGADDEAGASTTPQQMDVEDRRPLLRGGGGGGGGEAERPAAELEVHLNRIPPNRIPIGSQ